MYTRYLVSLLALTTVSSVFAHPGHDHSHWSSPAVHAVLFVAVFATASFGVWQLRKFLKARQK